MHSTRRHFLALSAAALLAPAPARAIATEAESVLLWQGEGPRFGGFSGIEISTDRRRALLLSDRGFLVRVRLLRDSDERLTAVERIEDFALSGTDGAVLPAESRDTEAMDQAPDGALVIGFEQPRGRLMRYPRERGPASPLPRLPVWRDLPGNAGIEALALDARGVPHVLLETPGEGGFALWQFNGDWRIAGIVPRRGDHVPVGLDFGPDGALYLLERRFRLAFFSTRISRLQPGAWDAPQTLVETPMGALGNHEGIAVARDSRGALWATTVSDDNQMRLLRTELAEFRLG